MSFFITLYRSLRLVSFALLFSGSGVVFAQVGAVVVDEDAPEMGGLRANPSEDLFAVAETIYASANTPEAKNNYRERARLLSLAAQKYSSYVARFPNSSRTSDALYKEAMCYLNLGQEENSYPLFQRIVAYYPTGPVSAAAAYRLATFAVQQGKYVDAQRYYRFANQHTDKAELRYDSAYRLAKVYLFMNQKAEAAVAFSSIAYDPVVPENFRNASLIALGSLEVEANRLESALAIYEKLAQSKQLAPAGMATVLFQTANIAQRLKQIPKAEGLYRRVMSKSEYSSVQPQAQVALMSLLYGQKRYEDVLHEIRINAAPLKSVDLNGKRALIAGQSAFALKRYPDAIIYFSEAEKQDPLSKLAEECAYKRLICAQEMKLPNFGSNVESFMQTYESRYPDSQYVHLVRVMLADALSSIDRERAAALFEKVDLTKLPESVRRDILYKRAWILAASQNRAGALHSLDEFVSQYPDDKNLAEALVLRGQMYSAMHDEVAAIADFNRVIKEFPKKDVAATAWQSAAHLYAYKQDTPKMIEYYEGLIKNFPQVKPATIAEAHYEMGKGYFNTKNYEKAVVHLSEAQTLNPGRYKDQVRMSLIIAYYQLQDANKLAKEYNKLLNENRSMVDSLPNSIPSWLGSQAYAKKDYQGTDMYLTLAADINEPQRTKKAIWATLAKARLRIDKFDRALIAINFYLNAEDVPARRAQGLLDKAVILANLKQFAEAKRIAQEAMKIGVEGPLKAALNIALGDIAYAMGDFAEAGRLYGLTSQLFTSDKVLKPQALYKAAVALEKQGKKNESESFYAELKREFPQWVAPKDIFTPTN